MIERNKRILCLDPEGEQSSGLSAASAAAKVTHRHVRTMTLVAFARLNKVKLKVEDLATIGARVVQLCLDRGVRPTEVKDERFGTIRLYPEWLLQEFFKVETGREDG